MTLESEKIFDYILIVNNEYIVKENTPQNIREKIKDFVENFKKIYHQEIKVKYM